MSVLPRRHRGGGLSLLTHAAVGTKPLELAEGTFAAGRLLRLVVLFWRENAIWLAGSFPRAFSDMPRSWWGTLSSAEEATDGARESAGGGDDCDGVCGCVSSSSESSSPIANVVSSSGT